MGYACPVCETPQRDGEHLANHLAFTALLGDDAHEAWLEEYAAGWEQLGPDELADVVVDHATETEFEAVFEDTVDRRDHEHAAGMDPDRPHVDPARTRERGEGSMDGEAQQILQQAQEMTEQLLSEDTDADAGVEES